MSRNTPEFALRFDEAELQSLITAYDYSDDAESRAAGRAIAQGEYDPRHFKSIVKWKTKGRGFKRLAANSDSEIVEALKFVANSHSERLAISALCGLSGVDVPVASTILAFVSPDRYTIIDFRALEALGNDSKNRSIEFYLAYLGYCRSTALRLGVSLRELDKALWSWSSRRGRAAKALPSNEQ